MADTRIILAQVLMDPPQYDAQKVAPLAIYSIGAYLSQEGIDASVVDPHELNIMASNQGGLQRLIGSDDTIIAFSVNSFNWPPTRKIISQIKSISSDTKIIVGGIHATYFPEQILKASAADIAVIGEAELNFVNIINSIKDGQLSHRLLKNISGIAYRKGGEIVVNASNNHFDLSKNLPIIPAYQFIPANTYQYLSAETSRGCTANCAFCSISYKNHWRCYKEKDMSQYFKKIIDNFDNTGSEGLYFVDDCFTGNTKRAIRVLEDFNRAGFSQIPIGIEARINDLLNTDLQAHLSQQKLWLVQTGVECGYSEGLDKVNKQTTIEKVTKAASLSKQFSINHAVLFSFIVGLPWESYNDCLKTIHFAAETVEKYNIFANISWHTLLPSRLWTTRKQYGIPFEESIFDRDQWFIDKEYFHKTKPNLSEEEYMRLEIIIHKYCDAGIPLRGFPQNWNLVSPID